MTEPNGFHEDDEPIEKLRAACAAARKGLTRRHQPEAVTTWSGDSRIISTKSSVPASHCYTKWWTPIETEDPVPA